MNVLNYVIVLRCFIVTCNFHPVHLNARRPFEHLFFNWYSWNSQRFTCEQNTRQVHFTSSWLKPIPNWNSESSLSPLFGCKQLGMIVSCYLFILAMGIVICMHVCISELQDVHMKAARVLFELYDYPICAI